MKEILSGIVSAFEKMSLLLKKTGIWNLIVVGIILVLFTLAMRIVLSDVVINEIPRILTSIREKEEKEKENLENIQETKFAAIQSNLEQIVRDNICDHCSVSLFHNGIHSLDKKFDFKYSEVILQYSKNERNTSDILKMQSTYAMPHYFWLKENKVFQGPITDLEHIDRELMVLERKNKVKYLRLEMIFKDGKPYANIAFAWEYIPKDVDIQAINYYTRYIEKQLID